MKPHYAYMPMVLFYIFVLHKCERARSTFWLYTSASVLAVSTSASVLASPALHKCEGARLASPPTAGLGRSHDASFAETPSRL